MRLKVREITVFALLAAMMFASKILMDALPNIHLLGMFVMTLTVVFRKKALYPIYLFVLITGVFSGFAAWWLPYLYIWTVLFGVTMLLPKTMKKKWAVPVYMIVCSLHGFCYGLLYAPSQMLLYGLTFKGMLAWIAAGIPFDLIHGISNFFCGALVYPFSVLLSRLVKSGRAAGRELDAEVHAL